MWLQTYKCSVYKVYNVCDASSYRISYSWCQQFNYHTQLNFCVAPTLMTFHKIYSASLKNKTAVYWRYITIQHFRILYYVTLVLTLPHTLTHIPGFYHWLQVVCTMLGSPPPANSSAGRETHRQTAHKSHKPTCLS